MQSRLIYLSHDEFLNLIEWINKINNLTAKPTKEEIDRWFCVIGRMRLIMLGPLDLRDEFFTNEALFFYGWNKTIPLQKLIENRIFSGKTHFDNSVIYCLIHEILTSNKLQDLCTVLKSFLPSESEIQSWIEKYPYVNGGNPAINLLEIDNNMCRKWCIDMLEDANIPYDWLPKHTSYLSNSHFKRAPRQKQGSSARFPPPKLRKSST